MEQELVVRDNFGRWASAVMTDDLASAVAMATGLFSWNGFTFLPTYSDRLIRDRNEAAEYYAKFFKSHPVPRITDDEVAFVGCSAYTHSGLYQFETDDGNGGRKVTNCKFTFSWREENGGWYIYHFQSSEVKTH
jgi:hypothetical protein